MWSGDYTKAIDDGYLRATAGTLAVPVEAHLLFVDQRALRRFSAKLSAARELALGALVQTCARLE